MTYTFKMSRRLAMVYAAFAVLNLTLTSCEAPQQIAGFTPPADTNAVALQVSPGSDTTSIAQLVQLRAVAVNAAGDPIPASFDWSSTGGSVDVDGRFSAPAAGSYWVRARHRHQTTLIDSSNVVVLAGAVTLTRLNLTPGSVTLLPGTSQTFTVAGQWSDGSTSTPSVNFTVTGGSINGGGTYTAGNTAGSFRVIATQQGGTIADTAVVTIAQPPATLTQVILTPSSVTLQPGATQPYSVAGHWSDGSSATPSVTYSSTGGGITSGGLYTAGTTAGTFRVIATSQSGTLADTSAVTIANPPSTLTAVVLNPASATLTVGGTRQFSVSGQWSDGGTAAPAVNYSATGGSITAGGMYTAGTSAGAFRVIATQQGGTLADTSVITVNPPTLTRVTLSPSSAALLAGATQQFSVSGQYSDGSTATPAVTWTATGGTVTSAGRYTAGSTAGSFIVVATQQGGSLADTSTVTITVPAPTQTSVTMTPSSVSLLSGATQQFTVSGRLSDGSSNTPSVNYSATGGSITAGGLYTSGSTAGSFRVIATLAGGSLADTSAVTVTVPAPTLTQVTLSPASATVASLATRQFSVSGRLSDGSTNTPAVTYSATGGTITSGGLFTAGVLPGSFRVIATQQGGTLADTAAVTVTVPVLSQIILTPSSTSVLAGGTFQFAGAGLMSDGSTTSPVITWTATGGSVSPTGLYTAGGSAGSFRVIATVLGGVLADTSTVTVTSGSTGAGAIFYSDWSSGTGASDQSLLDKSKSNPWTGSVSNNDPHGLLSVVSASGLGFPSSMGHVMRVTHPKSGPVYGHMVSPQVWSNPQVGETRYYRVYLASWIADDEGNLQGGYTSHHPFEDTQLTGSSAENWQFEYAPWGGGTNNGYFTWVFGMLNGSAWPRTRWHPGNGFANLRKFTAYRIEWSFTKTGTNTYTLNDLRIYSPTDDATLLYDKNSMYAADGSTRLVGNNTNLTLNDNQLNNFWIGTNGGSTMQMAQRDEYDYWGGVCIRSDNWCGAYAPGEH